MTISTTLLLAIELGCAEMLLFAAAAQVGNWLFWQDLKWTVGRVKAALVAAFQLQGGGPYTQRSLPPDGQVLGVLGP
jgi:hypothetical protein